MSTHGTDLSLNCLTDVQVSWLKVKKAMKCSVFAGLGISPTQRNLQYLHGLPTAQPSLKTSCTISRWAHHHQSPCSVLRWLLPQLRWIADSCVRRLCRQPAPRRRPFAPEYVCRSPREIWFSRQLLNKNQSQILYFVDSIQFNCCATNLMNGVII